VRINKPSFYNLSGKHTIPAVFLLHGLQATVLKFGTCLGPLRLEAHQTCHVQGSLGGRDMKNVCVRICVCMCMWPCVSWCVSVCLCGCVCAPPCVCVSVCLYIQCDIAGKLTILVPLRRVGVAWESSKLGMQSAEAANGIRKKSAEVLVRSASAVRSFFVNHSLPRYRIAICTYLGVPGGVPIVAVPSPGREIAETALLSLLEVKAIPCFVCDQDNVMGTVTKRCHVEYGLCL
jgi:hypothetical protein